MTRGNISILSEDYLLSSCWDVQSHGNSDSFWPLQRAFVLSSLSRITSPRQVFFLQRKRDLLTRSFKARKQVEPDFDIYLGAFDRIIKARYLFGIILVKLTIGFLCSREKWSTTMIILSPLSSLWRPFGITASSCTRMSPNALTKWFAYVQLKIIRRRPWSMPVSS
jgi:hypothetical protein